MKKIFGLSILCVLLMLTGCSSAKQLSEKEKLVSYLKTIGYDCGVSHCKTSVEDVNVYLLDDVYKKSEHSYINLTSGIIKEDINFVDSFLVGNETITIIMWETNYTLATQQYKVNYQYIEKNGESLITLANGTKTNSSFVQQDFPQNYIDTSLHLKSSNMESHSNEMYNLLITRWDRIFELAGVDKEKLIDEFED